MFAAYAQNPSLSVNDASAPTAKEDFVSDPEKLCTEIVVRDQQNQVAFHYRVQDSPGELCLEVVVADCSADMFCAWVAGQAIQVFVSSRELMLEYQVQDVCVCCPVCQPELQ